MIFFSGAMAEGGSTFLFIRFVIFHRQTKQKQNSNIPMDRLLPTLVNVGGGWLSTICCCEASSKPRLFVGSASDPGLLVESDVKKMGEQI